MPGKGTGAPLPIGKGVVGGFPADGGTIVHGHACSWATAKAWAEKVIFDSSGSGRTSGADCDGWPRRRSQSMEWVWKQGRKSADSISGRIAARKSVWGS